jgi:hypothetical protein
MTASEGRSVLDAMVSGIMDQKTKAAARPLTRVSGEAPVSLVAAPQPAIPNHPVLGDLTTDPDMVLQTLREARSAVERVLADIGRLESMWGRPAEEFDTQTKQSEALIQKEKERRADDAAKERDAKAAKPIEQVVAKEEKRLDKKAMLLAAMMDDNPDGFGTAPTDDADTAETFTERMARLQAEAQAAVFKPEPESPFNDLPHEVQPKSGGWECPTHHAFQSRKSARRGVEFRSCPTPGCAEFERV